MPGHLSHDLRVKKKSLATQQSAIEKKLKMAINSKDHPEIRKYQYHLDETLKAFYRM